MRCKNHLHFHLLKLCLFYCFFFFFHLSSIRLGSQVDVIGVKIPNCSDDGPCRIPIDGSIRVQIIYKPDVDLQIGKCYFRKYYRNRSKQSISFDLLISQLRRCQKPHMRHIGFWIQFKIRLIFHRTAILHAIHRGWELLWKLTN